MSSLLPLRSEPTTGSQDPRVVDLEGEDAEQVFSALSSSTARRIVAELHEQPQTQSDVAERLDTTVQNVRYHLDKLEDAGLVEVVDTWYSSRGNEMKVYAPVDGALIVSGDEGTASRLRSAISRLVGGVTILGLASLLLQTLLDRFGPVRGGFENQPTSGGGDAGGDGDDVGGDGGDGGEIDDVGDGDVFVAKTEETETTIANGNGGDGVETTVDTVAKSTDGGATTTPTTEAVTPTPGGGSTPTQTVTSAPSPTRTPAPSPTPTSTQTQTRTLTETQTQTQTLTETETAARTLTDTVTEASRDAVTNATTTTLADQAQAAAGGSGGLPPGFMFFLGGASVLLVLTAIWYFSERPPEGASGA